MSRDLGQAQSVKALGQAHCSYGPFGALKGQNLG